MKINPKFKKALKWFLIFDLYIEGVFFASYGVMYAKHNFRWHDKLIFEPQWVQDEDYIKQIGLEAKMVQWMKEDFDKLEEEQRQKELYNEVHADDMKIPRKKK